VKGGKQSVTNQQWDKACTYIQHARNNDATASLALAVPVRHTSHAPEVLPRTYRLPSSRPGIEAAVADQGDGLEDKVKCVQVARSTGVIANRIVIIIDTIIEIIMLIIIV